MWPLFRLRPAGFSFRIESTMAGVADVSSASRRDDEFLLRRAMGIVATQAGHLLSRAQRVGKAGNRMNRPRMSEAQSGIEFDLGDSIQIGPRHLRNQEVASDLFRGVAGKAERIPFGACLSFEFRGMRVVANDALAVLVGTMQDRVLAGLMALCAEGSTHGNRRYGRPAIFRHYLVAVLTAPPQRSMNELARLFLGMTRQTRFRLDAFRFDEWMLDGFVSEEAAR